MGYIAFLFVVMVAAMFLFLYNDHKRGIRLREQAEEEKRLQAQRERDILVEEVRNQATLIGDVETIATIDAGKYDGELPETEYGHYTSVFPDKLMILPIAGINYRSGIKTYVGDFKGVIVPERKNDYDPNAIMIKCEDGHHLGYIPEDETDSVRHLIGEDFARHRIIGHIDEMQDDDDGHKYFSGYVYIG